MLLCTCVGIASFSGARSGCSRGMPFCGAASQSASRTPRKLRTFSKSMIRCTSGCTMVMEIQRLRFSVHSGIDRASPNVSIASSSPTCAAAVGPVRTAGRGDGRYLLAEGDCVTCTASVRGSEVVCVCICYRTCNFATLSVSVGRVLEATQRVVAQQKHVWHTELNHWKSCNETDLDSVAAVMASCVSYETLSKSTSLSLGVSVCVHVCVCVYVAVQ